LPRNPAQKLVLHPMPRPAIRATVSNAENQSSVAESPRSIARENVVKSTTLKSGGKLDTTQ
jgi:hypothetical protein